MSADTSLPVLDAPDVSRETAALLAKFSELIRKWSPSINLISKNDLDYLETRHVADSLQLAAFLPKGAAKWVDVGSGGGFPAIVLAVMARELAPDTRFELIESDGRKAAFLRTAVRELGLNASVSNERIEAMAPRNCDIISARALAPLDVLLSYATRHLAPGGTSLFLKGRSYEAEVEHARQTWDFDLATYVSSTDASARVLQISDLQHV